MSIDAKVGQIITFGTYPQSDVTGEKKDPIEWRVLKVEDGKALVISVLGLDNVMFNTLNTSVTWATAELRPWLNETFMNAAFTADEQAQIVTSKIFTANSIARRVANAAPGCGETEDKIFPLSIDEANELFADDDDRQCQPSAYCKAKGAFTHASNGNCWWWLRNPGYYTSDAAGVNYNGLIHASGDNITSPSDAVRPAMWIALG